MAVQEILLLGNPQLYEPCTPVTQDESRGLVLTSTVQDLHDSMMAFRRQYGAGRAIAAPQIGVRKRLIYMHIDKPVVLLNPSIVERSDRQFETWDDCMSFPEVLVKVMRHQHCRIVYRDIDWREHSLEVKDNLAELLQHELDHLDGVLAVSRAIDAQSFALRSQQHFTQYDRSDIPGQSAPD